VYYGVEGCQFLGVGKNYFGEAGAVYGALVVYRIGCNLCADACFYIIVAEKFSRLFPASPMPSREESAGVFRSRRATTDLPAPIPPVRAMNIAVSVVL